jgi:t-SNARE complex subunit (syntaxin)
VSVAAKQYWYPLGELLDTAQCRSLQLCISCEKSGSGLVDNFRNQQEHILTKSTHTDSIGASLTELEGEADMLQKERNARRYAASNRERLTFVLVLLFIIVLLVVAIFPQAVPGEVIVIIARLLELVISSYFRRGEV